jgi:hypothetical protein
VRASEANISAVQSDNPPLHFVLSKPAPVEPALARDRAGKAVLFGRTAVLHSCCANAFWEDQLAF